MASLRSSPNTAMTESLDLRSWQAHVDGLVAFTHASLPTPLTFEQRPQTIKLASDADGTHRKIWPASLLFGAYLAEHAHLVAGKRVVELGAGSGVAGIVCAALGAQHVCLTDVPCALQLIRSNVARNERYAARCAVAPCRWGDEADIASLVSGAPFDVIVASELVYKQSEQTFKELVDTMAALSRGKAVVLVVYEFRGELFDDLVFFERMLELFEVEVVQLGAGSNGAGADSGAEGGGCDECEEFVYIYTPLDGAELSRRSLEQGAGAAAGASDL